MTTSHEFSKHNRAQKRCMNIYSVGVIYCFRPGTLWGEKGFCFSRSLITTHKFNNHSSIRLFLTVWHCKLTRHQCTCCHFNTIAYSSCLFTFMTRRLFSLRCPFNARSLVLLLQFKLLAIGGGGGGVVVNEASQLYNLLCWFNCHGV